MLSTSNAGLRKALLKELDRRHIKVWRVQTPLPPGVSDKQLREVAHRLATTGDLVRIERGVYLVPQRSGLRAISPLDLVGGWFASEPYAVVGAAAAEFHGLSLDTPSTIQVQLARRKYEQVSFQGKTYVFELADHQSVTSDNVQATGQSATTVAAPAKLVVLLLKGRSRGAGAGRDNRVALDALEMGRRRNLWAHTRWASMVSRHGNHAAARRLGFLLELLGLPGAEQLLPQRGRGGTVRLSPVHPDEGVLDSRWRLRINDPLVSR